MKNSLFLFLLAGALGISGQNALADEAKYEVHGKLLINIPLARVDIRTNPDKDTSEIFLLKKDGVFNKYFIKNGEYYVKKKKISINRDGGDISPFAFKDSILIPAIRGGRFEDIIQKIKFDTTASKNIIAKYIGSHRRDDLDNLFEEKPIIVHEILFENADNPGAYIDEKYKLKKGLVHYFINKYGKGIVVGGVLTVDIWGIEKNVYAGIVDYKP